MCMWEAVVEVAVSLSHDVMTSFWLHKWPRSPNYEPSSVGITFWGYCHMPMDSTWMCSNTWYMSLYGCGKQFELAVRAQPWPNDIILTPQVTQNPKIWAKLCWYNCLRFCHLPMDSISCSSTLYMSNVDAGSSLCWLSARTMTYDIIFTSDPEPQIMSQVVWVYPFEAIAICSWKAYECTQTLCICLMWMREAVWVGCQPQPWPNHIMLTPQVTQNPKLWAN